MVNLINRKGIQGIEGVILVVIALIVYVSLSYVWSKSTSSDVLTKE